MKEIIKELHNTKKRKCSCKPCKAVLSIGDNLYCGFCGKYYGKREWVV